MVNLDIILKTFSNPANELYLILKLSDLQNYSLLCERHQEVKYTFYSESFFNGLDPNITGAY